MDDATCFQEIHKGGEAARHAVTVLYQRYAGRFIASVMHRSGCPYATAEDVVQNVFWKLMYNLDRVPQDPEKGMGWMWVLVRNATVNEYRKQRSEETGMELPVTPTAPPDMEEPDCRLLAWRAFKADHPERAEALEQVVLDEVSLKELAVKLKRNYGAAREYVSQCRRLLRGYKRRWCGEPEPMAQGH